MTVVLSRAAVRRSLVVLVLVVGVVLLVASPAGAHADLIESSPAPGAVLDSSPDQIKLNFTESVDAASGAIRVFDSDGERIDKGGVDASGRTVTLPLSKLDDGSYVVTWRVTSTDGHPISGAFTFQVGQSSGAGATSQEVTGLADRLLSEQGGDQVVGVLWGIARFMVFAGLALLIGGAFFAYAIWPPARTSTGARRVVQAGWLTVTVATIVGFLLYGPYAEGLGLGEVFSTDLMSNTLDHRLGQVWLARLVLLVAVAPLLFLVFRRDDTTGEARPLPRWWAPEMAVFAVILSATPGLSGHATSGDWTTAAVIADTIHVLAMALWIGGLVVLAIVGLARSAPLAAREAVERFSRVALGCVVALVATGAFQTWRQVGNLDALRSTDYGRILVVKLVLVALIVVFAAFSREIVLRILPPPPREVRGGVAVVAGGSDDDLDVADDDEIDEEVEMRRLRRSVWAEIATAAAILAATALLVNAPPAKGAVSTTAEGGVVGITMRSEQANVDVTVTPGSAGANDVHVDVSDPSGVPKDVDELTVTFAQPDRGIAPIDLPLRRLSPGHYFSPGFEIPIAGEWRVKAEPLISEFDQPTLRGKLEIG